ncbi:MAG: Holliday junction resolvase RuvX [Culicoidibacterales bacterium]
MKRAVAFDVGSHTIGLAQSDVMKFMAQPLKTLRCQENEWTKALDNIFQIIDFKEVDTYVIGYPKMMNNTIGPSAERSIRFETKLRKYLNKLALVEQPQIMLVDERLTTVQAEKILVSADMNRKKRKTVIDTVAAVLILEDYLKTR